MNNSFWRNTTSLLLFFTVFFFLTGSSLARDRTDDDLENLVVTQWYDPEGSVPITYEEWALAHPPKGPYFAERMDDPDADPDTPVDIMILVEPSLYVAPLIAKLNVLIADMTSEGYAVALYTANYATPTDYRDFFIDQYNDNGMEGVLLIGDHAVPWFEMDDDFYGYASFPCDLFYMDLDGSWTDGDTDGMYDLHEDGTGDTAPEIYLGRLAPSVIDGDEAAWISAYLDKNHDFRTEVVGLPDRALVYVDDDWASSATSWSADMGAVYSTRTTVSDGAVTIASDYMDRWDDQYHWISLFAHSSPSGHSFKIGDEWTGGSVFWTDVRDDEPEAFFYNLFACSNSRYVENNFMGGWYVFVEPYAVAAIGSTKTGSMLNFDDFYDPLGLGGKSWARLYALVRRPVPLLFVGSTVVLRNEPDRRSDPAGSLLHRREPVGFFSSGI